MGRTIIHAWCGKKASLFIGYNGTVATVYNVGKINKGALPSAKVIAVVGSKPLGKTPSDDIISDSGAKSSENGTQHSLSSIDNSFYGNSDMITTEFLESDYVLLPDGIKLTIPE